MKKFSIEWKESQNKENGGWPQKHESDRHGYCWRWHYIQHETERFKSQNFRLMRECIEANKYSAPREHEA